MSVIRAFRSEWLKLLRPSILLGGVGAMAGFAVLAVVLRVSRVGGTHIGPGTDLTAPMVAASNGFAPIIVYTAPFLGLVALAVCAVAVGTEYSHGTLRNLLVRQPARLRLLTGKLLALASFVTLAVVVSYGVGLVAALLLMPGHGISPAAWFTAAGVQSLLATWAIWCSRPWHGALSERCSPSCSVRLPRRSRSGLAICWWGKRCSRACGRVALSGCRVCSWLPLG